jgi:A/G-specific adenine glycosylase
MPHVYIGRGEGFGTEMNAPDTDLAHDPAAALLAWYDRHRRVLPWRAGPGEPADPYRIWLSEIMLQQTTVAAVIPYFLRFLARWPNLAALAIAPLDDVLRAWAGLGYYARARNLHRCARLLMGRFHGIFPSDPEDLKSLPGIGDYTAAAIAAIAFGRPAVAVDGNVERVIARLEAIERPLPEAKAEIRKHARALLPAGRPGDFAQAMMDLGATVCTPKAPNCPICPWNRHCCGLALGIARALPRKAPKRSRPVRYGTVFWVERGDGAVLLRRRPEQGLLGGMMEIPSTDWLLAPADAAAAAPLPAEWKKLPRRVEHVFTHFRLCLDVWCATRIDSAELRVEGDYRWVLRADLGREALPSVMRKVVTIVLDENSLHRHSGEKPESSLKALD